MLPALIVGALTAWYLGMRAGIIAAIVTAAAMLIAMFVPIPGVTIAVYALVIAWSAAVYFLGSRIKERATGRGILGGLGGAASQATSTVSSWVKKLTKKS
ncbi:MAG: hypothetical protein WKG01_26335 [Kofleriaceae bacterium]